MTTAKSVALLAAAQKRTRDTRQRAVETLRRLDAAGETVTFAGVAMAAGVSRSWLYRQPDIRAEIDRLRTSRSATATPVPTSQRASTESIRRRLDVALDEIQRLKIENQQLREQVAKRFGQQRANGLT